MQLNKWIACEDHLPDSEITVMTYEHDSCEPIWPGYHDGDNWMDIAGGKLRAVTHWMAFPEPPEAGQTSREEQNQ